MPDAWGKVRSDVLTGAWTLVRFREAAAGRSAHAPLANSANGECGPPFVADESGLGFVAGGCGCFCPRSSALRRTPTPDHRPLEVILRLRGGKKAKLALIVRPLGGKKAKLALIVRPLGGKKAKLSPFVRPLGGLLVVLRPGKRQNDGGEIMVPRLLGVP